MYKNITICISLIFLVSCGQDNFKNENNNSDTSNLIVDTVAVVNNPENNLNIQTSSFSQIDSSGILMFPLAIKTESDRGSFSSKGIPGGSLWNIIFLNSKTNEYHLLSERKMLIRNYDFRYSSSNNDDNVDITETKRNIFYSVIIDDYNKDKTLDDNDPSYLFTTDKEGNNLKQISPSNCDLKNWQYVAASNKIIMTVKKDIDSNKKFDGKDELKIFEFSFDTSTEPKEIFSTSFENKLKILYNRDWDKKKK